MKPRPLPSQALIAHLWDYNPETGDMRWRIRHTHTCAKGVIDPTGANHGYKVVSFHRHTWLQHRLIWKLMTGEDPDPALVIDHIDEDPGNNRWDNLRQITPSENVARSSKHVRSPRVTAQRRGSGWQAVYRRTEPGGHVQVSLGTFKTQEEALAATLQDREEVLQRAPDNLPKVRRTASGRWEARVRVSPGKRAHLGTFDTREQALAAPVPAILLDTSAAYCVVSPHGYSSAKLHAMVGPTGDGYCPRA